MDKMVSLRPSPRKAAEYRAEIDAMLAEMKRLNEKMQQDQAKIERLKTETRIIAARTDAALARLEGLLNVRRTAA